MNFPTSTTPTKLYDDEQVRTSILGHYAGSGPHVALLYGGLGSERKVSFSSGKNVLQCLLELGHQVTAMSPGVDAPQTLLDIKPDVVFNCLHGAYGEDGTLPGILDKMRLPYTHSGARASFTCFYKDIAKMLCRSVGIAVPKHCFVSKGTVVSPIPAPYVIKPIAQGSSIGVSVVFPGDPGLEAYPFEYGDLVIVEEYIPGREIQVGLIDDKVLGMVELKYLKSKYFDYNSKYCAGFVEKMEVHLPPSAKAKVAEMAESFCRAAMCRGLVRAEFIYNEAQDKTYFLEANTHPGLTDLSVYPVIVKAAGMSLTGLINECVQKACFDF